MSNLKRYYDNHYYKMKIISMKTTTNASILFYDGYGQDLEVVLLNFINYGIVMMISTISQYEIIMLKEVSFLMYE